MSEQRNIRTDEQGTDEGKEEVGSILISLLCDTLCSLRLCGERLCAFTAELSEMALSQWRQKCASV